MAVTVVSAPDNGAPAHQAPSREAAKAAALEKINGPAKPEAEAPKPEDKKPDTTAAPAATAAAPAATKPQGEAEQLRAAIELERAVRSAEQSRNEAAQYRRELEQSRATDAARKQDWRRALADAGHDIESVVMDYVGGDGTAAASKPAQQPAQQGDSELAALRRELAELKNNLAQGAQNYTRGQRLESLRGLVRGAGDEYGVTSALEAEENLLAQLEKIEQQEGRQLGDVELRAKLTEFENVTREGVKAQLKRLGNTPWAKSVMRELLEEVKAEVAAAPSTPAAPTKTDLMNSDAAPASRVVLPRSLSDAKAQAKAKAIASMERRRSGLA